VSSASSALKRSSFFFSLPRCLPGESSGQFAADKCGAVGERAQFAEGALARQVFHSTIGRGDETLGRDMLQPLTQPRGDRFGRLDRRIIDISGDGTNNAGRAVTEARDQAVGAGVTINALAIINTQANPGYAFHTQPPGGLPKYFEENVIGGPGAFLFTVENFGTFAEAITRKLVTEIAGNPGGARTASAH